MVIEVIIGGVIITSAVVLFVRSMKNKSSGCCDCAHCSSHCSAPKPSEKNK
jgi:hypothetical protein